MADDYGVDPFLEKSKIEQENVAKMYAFRHGLENFNKGQYEQALKDFKAAQEIGIGLGNAYLAKMYLEGKGVEVDYKKAQIYAQNAIKERGSGILGGALVLGQIQAEGLGMKKDPKKALNTYRQVVLMLANKGQPSGGLENLKFGFVNDVVSSFGGKAIDLSGLSANSDDFKQRFTTHFFMVGKTGVDQLQLSNHIIVLKQEMGEILYRIGIAYKEGLGVRKQKNKAQKFLQKATEFGYEKAMEAM